MRYKLYNTPSYQLSAREQVLYNRGITSLDTQQKWLLAGNNDIYDWEDFHWPKMLEACRIVDKTMSNKESITIVVDCDCDGYTSTAIFINFLYMVYGDISNVTWIHHLGKQHGLSDVMNEVLETEPTLVVVPDGGSNDIKQHYQLDELGISCLILDHHEITIDPHETPAFLLNVQSCAYPNKALTGAGVVYKFIMAMEDFLQLDHSRSEHLQDLCALGNCGDMADYRELEIRAIMRDGFSHIENPFFKTMVEKQDYSIQKRKGLNYRAMSFYVVPFINAVVRSGTIEEKIIVFNSMLEVYRNIMVPSSKRGDKKKLVPLAQEAVLVAERVKRRQTTISDEVMAFLKDKIEKENLNQNSCILLLCEPGDVDVNIAGLAANKLQAIYQKPVLVLTHNLETDVYQGSVRNYSLSEVQNLKDILEATGDTTFVAGHQGAFGCGIAADKVDDFIQDTNARIPKSEAVYWIDYLWNGKNNVDPQIIEEIAGLNIYGQNIPEGRVAIQGLDLSECYVTLMSPDKHPTLKIDCGDFEIIKFGSSREEFERFVADEHLVLDVVCECGVNEWNGVVTPQLLVQDYELYQEWIF